MSLEPKPRSMAAVTITVLRWIAALVKSGQMLEHPSISQYVRLAECDNLSSADNQQERPLFQRSGILRDHTPDVRVIE